MIDAVGEARPNTYVIMVSDHGENAIEHRLAGKNNMYDSASRVAMMISGPGIKPNQIVQVTHTVRLLFPRLFCGCTNAQKQASGRRGGFSSLLVHTLESWPLSC